MPDARCKMQDLSAVAFLTADFKEGSSEADAIVRSAGALPFAHR